MARQSGSKVLGIGLSRTGTTSLHKALEMLGYKSLHFPPFKKKYIKYGFLKFKGDYKTYDALVDSPVALRYKKLDREFPGSKFILTLRADREKWLDSVQNHNMFCHENQVPNSVQLLHKKLYGAAFFDREMYCRAYNNHYNLLSKATG